MIILLNKLNLHEIVLLFYHWLLGGKRKGELVSKPSFCRKDVKLLSSVQKVIPIIKLSYFASAISSQTFCSFWKKVTNSPRPCKKIFLKHKA